MSDPGSDMPAGALICLFGAGGHGRVVAAQMARFLGLGCVFADTNAQSIGGSVAGWPVVAARLAEVIPHPLLITIGSNDRRATLQAEAQRLGADMATVVMEPSYFLSDQPAGAGSQIMASALVNAGARLGQGVIVNSRAVVEHDCTVGDFCHLAPGSVIGGGVRLGARVLLGTNATVLPGLSVADDVVIGAGAVVTRDIAAPGTYVGQPARRITTEKDI